MPSPEKKKDIPRYLQVIKVLSRELAKGEIAPHGLFYSEREMAKRFEVSPLTARKIYDIMERRRLLYRVHGKGTFVAPPSRRKRVLVVLDLEERFHSRDFDRVDFFLGAQEAGYTLSNDHEVVAIKEREFREAFPELPHRYPNLAGILFFRTIDLVVEIKDALRAQGVPFLFYGSSQHRPLLADVPARLYDEDRISPQALEHLWNRGCRRIAVAYIKAGASARRRDYWQKFLETRGLEAKPQWVFEAKTFYHSFHETLRQIPPAVFHEIDAIYCTVDSFAADAVQHLISLGLRVPGDVAVVTVNDSPICLQIHPNLTTVSIPLFEDARGCFQKILDLGAGKPGALHEPSPVSLILRESG